jgi:hypothetical protein
MNFNQFLYSKLGKNYYMGINSKALEQEIHEVEQQQKRNENMYRHEAQLIYSQHLVLSNLNKLKLITTDDYTEILAQKHNDL